MGKWRISLIYGMGAAMGWTVHDVKASSMWEFFAAWNGYVEANSPKDGPRLSEEQAEALFDWIDAGPPMEQAQSLPRLVWDGVRLCQGRVPFSI